MAAQPEIEKRVEKMVSNHRWMPPGYKVGKLHTHFKAYTDPHCRRSSVTLLSSRCGKCSRLVLYILEYRKNNNLSRLHIELTARVAVSYY